LPKTALASDFERLRADAGLALGDTVVLLAPPDAAGAAARADTAVVGAFVRRGADPAEIARAEYRVRLHLDQLQALAGYDNRVDRFAVATRGDAATGRALGVINDAAFGFRAYRSEDVAVRTSRTFQVVRRFHRAIGVITVVASAVFLLCILLLRIDERRRDVAALRLMGISRRTVVGALVLEASAVALLGSAMGLGIGWVASRVVNAYYQGVYRTPLLFALVTPEVAALAVSLSLALGVLAGLAASVRLARTAPLELFGR
ncbi:ABC transporter permease, partial [Roseisolibacter sp. H3M3-2]|uniref:ABC transporter permease n=1 Tax=Roseisolibacter sp. H3M3-2 TaxID=3031323 RepID=UPI0023DCABEA